MAKPPKDIAASVRARLLNLSREQEQDFQRVFVSYGLERLLYRLSVSKHRERYILKGGMFVTLWTIDPGRFTQDIDFLAFGHDDEERLQADYVEILGQVVDDGLVFDLDALTAAPILPTWEQPIIRRKIFELNPIRDGFARKQHDFKLYRFSSFTLNHFHSRPDFIACLKVRYLQRHKITSSEFAVERQIEHGKITLVICEL